VSPQGAYHHLDHECHPAFHPEKADHLPFATVSLSNLDRLVLLFPDFGRSVLLAKDLPHLVPWCSTERKHRISRQLDQFLVPRSLPWERLPESRSGSGNRACPHPVEVIAVHRPDRPYPPDRPQRLVAVDGGFVWRNCLAGQPPEVPATPVRQDHGLAIRFPPEGHPWVEVRQAHLDARMLVDFQSTAAPRTAYPDWPRAVLGHLARVLVAENSHLPQHLSAMVSVISLLEWGLFAPLAVRLVRFPRLLLPGSTERDQSPSSPGKKEFSPLLPQDC